MTRRTTEFIENDYKGNFSLATHLNFTKQYYSLAYPSHFHYVRLDHLMKRTVKQLTERAEHVAARDFSDLWPHGRGQRAYRDVFTACLKSRAPLHALRGKNPDQTLVRY